MNAFWSQLKDPRRSQQGSVLSAVLIMLAFVAIISGALTTELSTNFLLSSNLMNRALNEATVNSVMAQAVDQLQGTSLMSGCPQLGSTTLNGRTAVVSYASCAPVVDYRTSPQYQAYASLGRFAVDGAHWVISRAGMDVYMVGADSGEVYQYLYGSAQPLWAWRIGGVISGPPLAMPDWSGTTIDISNVVPLAFQQNQPTGCQAGGCALLLPQHGLNYPNANQQCFMPANGPVSGGPAQGVNNRTLVFFGDQAGSLFAYLATANGQCALQRSARTTGGRVVAGPLVFAGPVGGGTRTDELYVLTSGVGSSLLEQFAYTSKNGQPQSLASVSSLDLPAGAVGFAADSGTLPARVAITFSNGTVEVAQISSDYSVALLATGSLPAGIADAPAWCCGSPGQIAVAQSNALYVLDPGLRLIASFAVGTTISTSPVADSVGDWFFGGGDGFLYEAPAVEAKPTLLKFGGGQLGQIGSSVRVGGCGSGICLYVGSMNYHTYLVKLDARNAVLTACISAAPPTCSGANPRLWTQVEVGGQSSARTVHVQGWSYYSA